MNNSKRVLIVYPNCSMGGMATVYRNRVKANPDDFFKLIFANDLGGRSYFDDVPNVEVIIVRKGRMVNYLKHLVAVEEFSKIMITSLPEIANAVSQVSDAQNVYEFHTSTDSIIQDEISKVNFESMDAIQVPSEYLQNVVSDNLPRELHELIKVVPNLVDQELFAPRDDTQIHLNFGGKVPLVWVGRLDSGKNVNDFLRVLSRLDDSYLAIIILGLEHDPSRFANFLGYAAALGVKHKIRTLVNLPQSGIADIYNIARKQDGYFVSTSLGESFGYGIQEALATGLNTVAYRVGALSERTVPISNTRYSLVDVGDIDAMVYEIAR